MKHVDETLRTHLLKLLRYVPVTFVVVRFALGPVLYLDASDGRTTPWFVVGLVVASATDLFDGIIARRTHTVTADLREWDGRTDVWFYGWLALCIWQTHPDVLFAYRAPLLLVLGLQVLAWVLDLAKFRRFSNYHAYSAKALGFWLFLATVSLFAVGTVGVLLWIAIAAGVICMLEEMAITLILPRWTFDVWSVRHALRIRRELLQGSDAQPRRAEG